MAAPARRLAPVPGRAAASAQPVRGVDRGHRDHHAGPGRLARLTRGRPPAQQRRASLDRYVSGRDEASWRWPRTRRWLRARGFEALRGGGGARPSSSPAGPRNRDPARAPTPEALVDLRRLSPAPVRPDAGAPLAGGAAGARGPGRGDAVMWECTGRPAAHGARHLAAVPRLQGGDQLRLRGAGARSPSARPSATSRTPSRCSCEQ
ncbi:hypothetical protein QJS66_18000 [Kocuria rhizophila]|nr:hypothetical protein QJS66_18000 [Kocuria rhizophila]